MFGKPDLASLVKRKKTPFILQMEAVECGAAALAIVMGYHGRFVPLARLRLECGVSRDGSKASNILKAARKHGLDAKGYSKGVDKLAQVSMPCIVFWEFNHFIVVEGMTSEHVYVNDPAAGHRTLSPETFSAGFTGVVLTFAPTPEFKKEGSLPNPLPTLYKYSEGSRKALVFVMLCGLLGTVPGIATAALTRLVLDSVIGQGHYDWLRPILVAMLGVMVIQVALTSLSGLFYRRMSMGLSARLKAQFFRHLMALPYQFYSQRYTGDVVDRGNLVDGIVSLIAGRLTSTIVGLLTMIVFGFVLFSFNPVLTLLGVLATLLNFVFMRMVSKRRVEANIVISKDRGKLQAVTIATIQSIDTIKASGLEDSIYEKWAGYYAAASNGSLKLELESRAFSVLPTLTNTLVNTGTTLFGGLLVMQGEMSFGTLMAFNLLMGQFLGPLSSFISLSVDMQQIRGAVVRLHDIMEHPTRLDLLRESGGGGTGEVGGVVAEDGKTDAAAVEKPKLDGNLTFSNVTYGYSPLGDPLIQDFSLEVKSGERVALVGRSGCGKSTVAKLAAGLLVPWSGQIQFDGRGREGWSQDLMVNSCAMIEQDISFFAGTIRANLTLWDDTIPDQWILDACEDAEILDAVLALPGGLNAKVAEGGGNFSGGQRQRLEIARALVRKPSLLILDEATSALDSQTEAKIMANIHRRGCSCLIVAHRLSTVRNCHKIIVMDKGRIVEDGTHEQLWRMEDGIYASLLSQVSSHHE